MTFWQREKVSTKQNHLWKNRGRTSVVCQFYKYFTLRRADLVQAGCFSCFFGNQSAWRIKKRFWTNAEETDGWRSIPSRNLEKPYSGVLVSHDETTASEYDNWNDAGRSASPRMAGLTSTLFYYCILRSRLESALHSLLITRGSSGSAARRDDKYEVTRKIVKGIERFVTSNHFTRRSR